MTCNTSVSGSSVGTPTEGAYSQKPGCVGYHGIPEQLREYITAKDESGTCVRDFQSLKVCLGPYNSSYLAVDGNTCAWANLPPSMDSKVDEMIKAGEDPRVIALGANRSYIIISTGQAASWELDNGYETLKATVEALAEEQRAGKDGMSLIKVCTRSSE